MIGLKKHTQVAFSQSPGRVSWEILNKDKRTRISFAILLLIIALAILAPIYSSFIAHTNPFVSSLDASFNMNGKTVQVLQPSTQGLGLGVTPIGPTWKFNHYFLGADSQGRDIVARILYGGRNTLFIGFVSSLLTMFFAILIGVIAGYYRGFIDNFLSRILDLIWAFPVYLLAISLSVVLLTSGLNFGFIHFGAGSLALPIFIIGMVYIPYVARPLRAQVLSIRERDFVKAAIGYGAGNSNIIFTEILPNVLPSALVFFPIMVALNMLTESALSFLSIGVQPPSASWGTIINDGLALLYTRPLVAILPGLMIVITAAALNLYGDAVRDALDPKLNTRIIK